MDRNPHHVRWVVGLESDEQVGWDGTLVLDKAGAVNSIRTDISIDKEQNLLESRSKYENKL